MSKARFLAFAQLLRLPNVFTAFSDIALGACAAGYLANSLLAFVLLLLASGSLYLAGMVWNDWFDRREDARTQKFRPIPSGRVASRTAFILGCVLVLLGWTFAALAGLSFEFSEFHPLVIAVAITVAVFAYDAFLKHTPVGPVGMGLCRFLNVLLGLSGAGGDLATLLNLHLAAVIGVYIVGVTWFARTEETSSNRWQLAAAAGVMAVALLVGLMLPMHKPEGFTPFYFPYLLVAFGFYVGLAVVKAIANPDPKHVQAAIKRSILGLVILDAVLATVFVGWPGLAILLLLIPARLLGRWVYST